MRIFVHCKLYLIMKNCKSIKLHEEYDLIDILSLQPSIKKDIKYMTPNNFSGKILYDEDLGLYCEPALANAVAKAQEDLKSINKDLSLVIFDAARPMSVQKEMFEMVRGTKNERFIANPYGEYAGGFHNYGMAVDVAIVDKNGAMLDFGTDYDCFEDVAHSGNEAEMVKCGKLSIEAYQNRTLLYYVMGKNGMLPYTYEWWHFQITYNENDKLKFKLLDF